MRTFVRASGKCAECHRNNQYSIVHEYEMSNHAQKGVTCLDCHQVQPGQTGTNHNGFVINTGITAANCRVCHQAVYDQFARSRHAAPSWAAVIGNKDFSPEKIDQMEKLHPGSMKRPPHPLTQTGRRFRDEERLHHVPRDRQAQRRRHHRQLHALPHAAHVLGRGRAPAEHLRPVPHGAGPFADRNLHESKHGVMFAAQQTLLNLRAVRQPDHARHVHPDLRDLPHERTQRPRRHARPVRAALV